MGSWEIGHKVLGKKEVMSKNKECRYAIYYKNKKGVESNLFSDGRSFKTYKWANTIKNRQSFNTVEAHGELYLKEVPKINTDTERFEHMAKNGYGVYKNFMGSANDHFFVFNHRGESIVYRDTFREAIDWAMENIR